MRSLLGDFELAAEAKFFCFEVVGAHEFGYCDVVLVGDLPEAVTGLDDVDAFAGFGGGGFGLGCGFGGGCGEEEAVQGGLVVVGFGEELAGEGVEDVGRFLPDGVGAGRGEEFFGEEVELGGLGVEQVEEGEDAAIVEAFEEEFAVVVEEELSGRGGVVFEVAEEQGAAVIEGEVDRLAF